MNTHTAVKCNLSVALRITRQMPISPLMFLGQYLFVDTLTQILTPHRLSDGDSLGLGWALVGLRGGGGTGLRWWCLQGRWLQGGRMLRSAASPQSQSHPWGRVHRGTTAWLSQLNSVLFALFCVCCVFGLSASSSSQVHAFAFSIIQLRAVPV